MPVFLRPAAVECKGNFQDHIVKTSFAPSMMPHTHTVLNIGVESRRYRSRLDVELSVY